MSKITKQDILDLDPGAYTNEDKDALVRQLFGDIGVGFANELANVTAEMERWTSIHGADTSAENQYKTPHASLIEAARRIPPWTPRGRVTDFSDWVFRLYNTSNYQSLARGAAAEREIALRRIPRLTHNERWKLIYDGMGEKAQVDPCAISNLSINGRAIYGSPDLVFRDKKEQRILILELKATTVPSIPSDGWPNLRAQLWAYSQIDRWADAKEISLVAEIWGVHRLKVRKVIGWRTDDVKFQSENRELWEIYQAGQVSSHRTS